MRWWHIAAAVKIEQEIFAEEAWTAAGFWSELAQRQTRYYRVAQHDEELIGYAGLCVYGEPPNAQAWVQNIAVRKAWQGKGIGARLLDDLLDEAVRRKAADIWLEVAVDNAHAQRIYARRGFEPMGIRKGYYQPSNTDALTMRREL
ncbi:MAG: ribosomal protein S18-alanine N-acetyltransferase [Corynebacteriales bacterium]|nr:ribosomal protein S18-alanine N-acetyltransferase [Mycobacteriales bacterium]